MWIYDYKRLLVCLYVCDSYAKIKPVVLKINIFFIKCGSHFYSFAAKPKRRVMFLFLLALFG